MDTFNFPRLKKLFQYQSDFKKFFREKVGLPLASMHTLDQKKNFGGEYTYMPRPWSTEDTLEELRRAREPQLLQGEEPPVAGQQPRHVNCSFKRCYWQI